MKSYWVKWLRAAGIRAIKTVAQSAIATISTTAMFSEVDWVTVFSAALLAGLLSLMTSIAGLPEVDMDTDTYERGAEDETDWE